MKFTIKNDEINSLNGGESINFPKYTSQLINWANQNAQGTRPRVVGQLSDLFPEYQQQASEITMDDWQEWYLDKYPDAIEHATDKIFQQVKNLQNAIKLIDRDLVEKWVNDLVITKTFNGLYVQQAILSGLASRLGKSYRLANKAEESIGIDGYVGTEAYSIKPDTYKTMSRLSETINVKMIYYTKKKTGLTVEVEE